MKKILIADDDPAICDSVQMILEDEGYAVDTTGNGESVTNLKDNLPDLLLLDVWMSGQDGKVIAKYLKSRNDTKKIPIIMVSASRDLESSAKESGADDFLAKPFSMSELLSKVQRNIEKTA